MPGIGNKIQAEANRSGEIQRVRPGQRVRMEGRDEIFVVLRVDHQRHVADLLRHGKVSKVESGVPLALLRPAHDKDRLAAAD